MIDYRCTRCDSVRSLNTDGEREIRARCQTCNLATTQARVYDCRKCGKPTSTPKWPKEFDQDGPICNGCYGRLLMASGES